MVQHKISGSSAGKERETARLRTGGLALENGGHFGRNVVTSCRMDAGLAGAYSAGFALLRPVLVELKRLQRYMDTRHL